jgi:hypothetical protein
MQIHKFLKYLLFIVFISAIAPSAYSGNESFMSKSGISQDSIPKSEIAEYRKRFESVEKMIASRRGTYQDAKNSFNGISGSRVRNLPEFAGRFSAMQSKLNAWNLEVNPKQPPVVVPNNPSNPPKNTGKTNEPVAKPLGTEVEHKSLMLSYFPDTLTVGNNFLAYVEITKDNTVKFGNLTGSNNTLDSIIISSLAGTSGINPGTQITVELTRDGGSDNFTIASRSDKTKTLTDNGSARWEWNLSPTTEGDSRFRLSVTYKKVSKDGVTQDVPAMNKFITVKGLAQKTSEPKSNYLPWIIVGALILLGLVGYALSRSKNKNKNRHDRHDDKHIIQR